MFPSFLSREAWQFVSRQNMWHTVQGRQDRMERALEGFLGLMVYLRDEMPRLVACTLNTLEDLRDATTFYKPSPFICLDTCSTEAQVRDEIRLIVLRAELALSRHPVLTASVFCTEEFKQYRLQLRQIAWWMKFQIVEIKVCSHGTNPPLPCQNPSQKKNA